MTQTREKWDSLVLSRGDFCMIWRCHGIPCFHFYFLFRNNAIREQLDESDFLRCHGILLFESTWSHFFQNQNSFSTITRHLNNGIWKTLYKWRFYGHGSTYMSSLHQNIWLITLHASFSQTSLVFKFNLLLIE